MAQQTITRIAVNRQRRSQLNRWYGWRKRHGNARNRQRAAHYAKGRAHDTKSKKRWSAEDVVYLLSAVLPDREIALQLGRSVQAVEMKRLKLKAKGAP